MFQGIAVFSANLGLIFAALAIGASWVAAIASPNCSFDELDGSRADRHVRELLHKTSTPIAGMMLASGAFFLLAAFGFFSNRWMLAPKTGKNPKGVRTSRKGQRQVSVSLSLIFTLIAIIAAILGLIGV